MGKTEKCLYELDAAKLFHELGHRSRFKELMDVFSGQPFFCKGICKCMYLAAWDDEHFLILLEMLSAMSFGSGATKDDMMRDGEDRKEASTEAEQPLYALSVSYMTGTDYHKPDDDEVDPETMYIINCALEAEKILDRVFED